MSSIADRITLIVALLRTAIGLHADRERALRQVTWLGGKAHVFVRRPGTPPPLPDAVWDLLWIRLARMAERFQRLYDRWRSNTLPTPRPGRPRPAPPRPPEPDPAAAPPAPSHPVPAWRTARLPRAWAWVNRRVPESAPPTGHLTALLADPELRAFVAAAPQAGRLLRPLCRALGARLPDWLRLPPRPRTPRPPRPRRERPPSLSDPGLNLRPYVLAAAKAWKKFG